MDPEANPPAWVMYPQLLLNPGRFLSQHQVIPAGNADLVSSMQQRFEFMNQQGFPGAYRIWGLRSKPTEGSHIFTAAYVKMEPVTAAELGTAPGVIASRPFEIPIEKTFILQPPEDPTKHVLMITGQLTGCTMCWRKYGNKGAVIIAHLQPKQSGFNGEQLEKNVLLYGRLNGQEIEAVYGCREYGNTPASAHFFGVWHPDEDRWRFFVQHRSSPDVHAAEGVGSVVEVVY